MNSENELHRQTVHLESLEIPIWVFDVDALTFIWANSAGLVLWNSPKLAELCSRDMSLGITPAMRARLFQYCEDLECNRKKISEHWTFYPDGQPQTYECFITRFNNNENKAWLLVHAPKMDAGLDVETLYRANALLHTSVPVSLYNSNGLCVYANPAARAMLGEQQHRLADRFCDPIEWEKLQKKLNRGRLVTTEARVLVQTGQAWHRLTLEMCPDPVSGDRSVLVSEFDVTERREAQARVRQMAYTDALTGLHNRTFLLMRLTECIASAKLAGGRLAILFIDLDRFKVINDSLGHAVGDSLLSAVSRRLEEVVNSGTLVARLGGDEFTVLIPSFTEEQEVLAVADKIVSKMECPLLVDGYELLVTPSIGISIFPNHGSEQSSLMQHADLAMYEAKANGGGRQIFDYSMNTDTKERLLLEGDLRTSLQTNELEVHYQPKVHTKTGEVVGMEALIRWNHPSRGMVPPLDFIGVAEETGMISQITKFVLWNAMRQQKYWQNNGHTICVAINISPREFRSGDVSLVVEQALLETGCDPKYVELEITESMLMADSEMVQDTLNSIKALGVRLSIDDFGTGYSNLAYLQKFPIDCLKIDRSFLAERDRRGLLEMIIGIGKVLSLTVVAEGVETEEQLKWLTDHDCDEVQGFLFSAPLAADAATHYLKSHGDWRTTWLKTA